MEKSIRDLLTEISNGTDQVAQIVEGLVYVVRRRPICWNQELGTSLASVVQQTSFCVSDCVDLTFRRRGRKPPYHTHNLESLNKQFEILVVQCGKVWLQLISRNGEDPIQVILEGQLDLYDIALVAGSIPHCILPLVVPACVHELLREPFDGERDRRLLCPPRFDKVRPATFVPKFVPLADLFQQ